MVKIKGKITRVGNSYGILIKKALVDAEVLSAGQEVELELVAKESQENSGVWTRTSDADVIIPIVEG